MARFRPRRALEPRGACQNAHTFNILSDKHTHRFEEVNNYSRLMTRWFCSADETSAKGPMPTRSEMTATTLTVAI